MNVFIIITNKLHFSNEIINYFKEQNTQNNFLLQFLPVGLDESDENTLLNNVYQKISEFKNKEIVVVFSDVGLPTKFAKRIIIDDENISFYRSKGSLIENGYLTYLMLNTKTPKELINQLLEEKIEK